MKPNTLFLALFLALSGAATAQAQQYDWMWAKRLGGVYTTILNNPAPSITAKTMTATPDGGVVVGGSYSGPLTVEEPTQTFTFPNGLTGGFITKYSATGTRLWSHTLNGIGPINEDEVRDIGTDATGTVYVSGRFNGRLNVSPTILNGPGSYLSRYDGTSGNLLSIRKITTGVATLTAMRVNAAGMAYIVGKVGGPNQLVGYPVIPDPNASLTTYVAAQDPVSGIVPWVNSLIPRRYSPVQIANSTVQVTDLAIMSTGMVVISGTFSGEVDFGSTNTPAGISYLRSIDVNNQPVTSGFIVTYGGITGQVGSLLATPLPFQLLTANAGRLFVVANPTTSFTFGATAVTVTPGTGVSEQDLFIGEINPPSSTQPMQPGQVLYSGGGPGRQNILNAVVNPVSGEVALALFYTDTPQIGTLTFAPATSPSTAKFAVVQFASDGTPRRVLAVPVPFGASTTGTVRVALSPTDDPLLAIPVSQNGNGSQFGSLPATDLLYPGGTTLAVVKAGIVLAARDPKAAAPLSLYPNPARDQVRVAVPGWPGARVSLLDALGRHCWQGELDPTAGATVPVASLTAGLYVLRVTRPDGTTVSRRLTVAP